MPNEREGMSAGLKIVFGAQVGLLVTLLCSGLLFWNQTSTRLALLESKQQDTAESEAMDRKQNESIGKLWVAAGQNRDAINERHRDEDLHKWRNLGGGE